MGVQLLHSFSRRRVTLYWAWSSWLAAVVANQSTYHVDSERAYPLQMKAKASVRKRTMVRRVCFSKRAGAGSTTSATHLALQEPATGPLFGPGVGGRGGGGGGVPPPEVRSPPPDGAGPVGTVAVPPP